MAQRMRESSAANAPRIMNNTHDRIIAVDVHAQVVGFAVLEGRAELLDWGVRSFRGGVNTVKISFNQKFRNVVTEFQPQAVVLNWRPSPKSNRKAKTIMRLAKMYRIRVHVMSARHLQKAFLGCSNAHEIATQIAARFPELASRLPHKRKTWETRHYRMNIFDAVSFGVAYFETCKRIPDGQIGSLVAGSSSTNRPNEGPSKY